MKPAYWMERMGEYMVNGAHVVPAVRSQGRQGRRVGPRTEYLNPEPDEIDVGVAASWAACEPKPVDAPAILPLWRRALFAIAVRLIGWARG